MQRRRCRRSDKDFERQWTTRRKWLGDSFPRNMNLSNDIFLSSRICILNEHREHKFQIIVPNNGKHLEHIAGAGDCWCNRLRLRCSLRRLSGNIFEVCLCCSLSCSFFVILIVIVVYPCGSFLFMHVYTLRILLLLKLFFMLY